jgi:hypothetical protein
MDPLAVLDRLNTWRRQWNDARESMVRTTLALALDSCRALISIEDIKSDSAVLLHERVKSLYQGASGVLSGRLQPEDLEIVIDALASARMYYWIRFLNGQAGDELEMLIRRRSKAYGGLPSSLGMVYLAIRAVVPQSHPADVPDLSEESLTTLKEGCLADVARLEVVVSRYGGVDS